MLFRNLPFFSQIRKRWAGSIGFRHTVGLCIVILLVMDIASSVMFYETSKAIRKAAEDRGLAFTRTFAMMGGMAVLDNLYRIQEAMSQYLQDPDILQIDVIDQDGMIVAANGPI